MGEGSAISVPSRLVHWAIVGACLVSPLTLRAQSEDDRTPRIAARRPPAKLVELRDYSLQYPSFGPSPVASAADGATTVTVTLGSEICSIRLHPDSLRAPSFKVYTQGNDGDIIEAQTPPSTFLRGTLDDDPAADVVGSLSDDGLSLQIVLSTHEVWIVQPASELGVVAADDAHIVYRAEDVRGGDEGCGAGDSHDRAPVSRASSGATASDIAAGVTLKVAEIAFDVDHEFYVLNNSSVADTVRDVETILARVSQIYEAEAGITYELTAVVIRAAEPDPYFAGNASELLTQFAAEWNANMRHIPRDTAHLMSGKILANSVIGTANINAMCDVCGNNAEGYGLSRSRFSNLIESRAALTAHEIGHNWGASHCDADADCGIMCSQLGGCSGDVTHFGSTPLADIDVTRDDAPCLGDRTGPLEFPFCDDFNVSLNAVKWSYNNIASVSGGSVNPPSPPTALLLNGCCSGCNNTPWPDDIRSTFVRLGGLSTATLVYHTEFRGTAATAGSQLVVEILQNTGQWFEVSRLTADGTNQNSFQSWLHPLPSAALHDGFRLRFHLDGSTPHADWYIDDVTITNVQPDSPILYVKGSAAPGGTGESWATAFKDLQTAISVADCSLGLVQEIWVAAGTYKPDRGAGDRDDSFILIDGVALYGGFRGGEWHREDRDPTANKTILSGEIGNQNTRLDNSRHVVTSSGTGPDAILDGFTVTRGQADGFFAPDDAGGGLLNISGAPTIARCVFQDNRARRGAAMNHTLGAAPTISATTFLSNSTTASSGAAIFADLGTMLTVDRARFIGNGSPGGGGALYLADSSADFRNSLFSYNIASTGGAIYATNSGVILTNCTLAANLASTTGGGITNDAGFVSLTDCILWSNRDASGMTQAAQFSGLDPVADYSIVQNLASDWGGTHNLAADPLFRDPDGPDNAVSTLDDDFRLMTASPAIDTGDPSFSIATSPRDLDEFPRILRLSVDIGAYEFGMADFDQDRVTERSDALQFSACMTGQTNPYPAPCRVFDFDADADLDLRDLAKLTNDLSIAPPSP